MKLVFVSSTFKDMQFERDMLHTHVIPLLDTKLTKYGESVRFGDLRWGVNTTEYSEEESSKKVLKVCLDQIDDCKPYMIVFIGERYGWIPSQDLIKNAAVFKGIDNIEDDISVTQLEIEYGALLNPDYEGRILFYFRNLDKEGMTEEERKTYEAESPLHEQKILSLKEKIYKLYPNFVRSYNAKWNKETKKVENLDPLMDLIKEDLEKIFTYDIEKNNSLDWQERAILASHEFYKEKNKVYVNTKTIVRKLKKNNESVLLWRNPDTLCSFQYYVGEDGTGKSTRVSNVYMRNFNNDSKNIVIPFVYQIDDYTSTFENLYYIIIYHLEKALGLEHKHYDYLSNNFYSEIDSIIEYLLYLIKKIKDKYITVNVVVDNVKVRDFFCSFKKLEEALTNYETNTNYENLPIYFTFALNEKYLPSNVPFFDISESFPLDKLYKEEIKDIILNILKFSRKELSNEVINHLIEKEQSNDPYYLSLIINRLLMLDSDDFKIIRDLGDGMNAINQYMTLLIDSVGGNIKDIIKEIVKEIAERIDYDFVCKFLAVTTYTDLWLKKKEYEEIFKYANWNYIELNASLLLNNLKFVFDRRSYGTEYKITNKEVLKGIKEFIIESKYDYVLNILFDYVKQLPSNHELKNYDLHFALSTQNGEFIAKYYLNNIKELDNSNNNFDVYTTYSDFIVELVENNEYEILLDFIKTLCIENASISNYYLITSLTKTKLNKDQYKQFVNFTVDLQTWLNNNKQINNQFIDGIFVWLQLIPCMNLVQLESRIAFQRALIVYGYCSMMKRSLPRELVAEASIVLLQTLLKRIDVTDNYDVVKMYFTEMVDFSCLDNVIFKDYYLTIIKGYIAKLISAICMRKNDELYETYELIYQETLDNGCVNRTFETIYPIVQESYAIGYFNHSYLYVNIDYDYYLRTVINYYYSSNVLPLQNDIDKCLLAVDYSDYNDEQDIKNMLYRTYKKTLFLNNYYDGYKKNVFLVISKILEKLNSIETDVLDEISNVLENLFIDVIEDYYLVFEGGSDEFISSAVMDNLEYFVYLVYQLYLFNMADSNKKILKTILLCLNNSLQEHNPYITMVINTLLYSFTDSTEEEDEEYIKEFEKSYEIRDKNDSLYLNYKRLVNACILYISGSISFEEFGDYLYKVYNDKIHIDRKINY